MDNEYIKWHKRIQWLKTNKQSEYWMCLEKDIVESHKIPINFCCISSVQFSSVAQLSHVWLFAIPRNTACQASLSITNSWSLPKPMSIKLVMPSSHLILCRPLLLLPPILPSIRVFSNESTLHIRWPKYWSFSFNISPSNEHPGLISFRMDCLDLFAVQGTLKSLLQHHSSKADFICTLWLISYTLLKDQPVRISCIHTN